MLRDSITSNYLKKRHAVFFTSLILAGLLVFSAPVSAKSEYAQKTGKLCSFCHAGAPPALNAAGEYYKEHKTLDGYKAAAGEAGPNEVNVQTTRHFGENCPVCHNNRRKEWEKSKHATAYTDPIYQDAISKLDNETREKCVVCHTTNVGGTIVESVACVACHNEPDTVRIDKSVEKCRGCHSGLNMDPEVIKACNAATPRARNEFERWSFAKHSNATARLLASVEFNALETVSQKLMCLSCHSTDFEVSEGDIKIDDGDIGCIVCHGGIDPKSEIESVEEGKFGNYALARQNSIKNINHTYAVPEAPDFCGNCHTGYHHPQAVVWRTGEHAGIKCVKCHGETVVAGTLEIDMDHTFVPNLRVCGECHDASERLERWESLKDLEHVGFKNFHRADGALKVALDLGVSKVYLGEAQRKLINARGQLGLARNAYFHNQKLMRSALTNATALSEDAATIIENSIVEFKDTMRGIAYITTVIIIVALLILFGLYKMWEKDHKLLRPVKKVLGKIRHIRTLPPNEKKVYISGVVFAAVIFLAVNGGFAWYSTTPSWCKNCHIMKPMYETWKEGPHNKVNCHECHIETKIQSAAKGFNYGSAILYGRYAATGIPEVSKEICKECHELEELQPKHLISRDAHQIHPSYFNCNICHKTHLVTVNEDICVSCHVPGYTRVTEPTSPLLHTAGKE